MASPTSGGRSVGIVRSRTQTMEFSSFLVIWICASHTQPVDTLDEWSTLSQGRCLHRQHRHRRNDERHPCLKWNSNPWSQCSSSRRHFMPWMFVTFTSGVKWRASITRFNSIMQIHGLRRRVDVGRGVAVQGDGWSSVPGRSRTPLHEVPAQGTAQRVLLQQESGRSAGMWPVQSVTVHCDYTSLYLWNSRLVATAVNEMVNLPLCFTPRLEDLWSCTGKHHKFLTSAVVGNLLPGVKLQERETNLSSPSNSQVNACNFTSFPHISLHFWELHNRAVSIYTKYLRTVEWE
jgi:hypothetical protein